jgi:curved DNA-binding protein CbpA
MATQTDLYAVLGVAPDCEDFVIQAAYRALMRRYHPDTNSDPEAAQKAQAINDAYAVLGNSQRRANYDSSRGTKSTGQRSEERSQGRAQSGAGPKSPPPPPTPPENTEVVEFSEGRGLLASLAFLGFLAIPAIIYFVSISSTDAQADNTMNVDETMTTDEVLANDTMNIVANAAAAAPAKLSEMPMTPVEYSTIEGSANEFARIVMKSGIAGARNYSQDCHRKVDETPTWAGADSCAAFDLAAAYIDQQICSDRTCSVNGYFQFQQQNLDDSYESAGATPYTVAGRINQIKAAVEPAAEEAVRTAITRAEAAKAARATREPTPAPADPFANASNPSYADPSGVTRND